MVLAKIGVILDGVAAGIIVLKLIWFMIVGNFTGEAVSNFIASIFMIGVDAAIPLEVTLIQIFGVVGVVLIIADAVIFRG